jgi:hypothetical protein
MSNTNFSLKWYKEFLNPFNIRHQAFNYSMTSHGARHPDGPVGWILRDEGQADIYAGKARIILSTKGEHLSISTNYANMSERAAFHTKGITNFRILGKHFVKEIFNGQKVVAIKEGESISSYSVIGPNTKVIVGGMVGDIINPVPMNKVFDERMIFDSDPEDKKLLPSSVEIVQLLQSLMRG